MDPSLMVEGIVVNTPSDVGLTASWTIFANAYDMIDTPLVNAIDGILDALTGYVSGPLKLLIIAWLGATAIMIAIHPNENIMGGLIGRLLRAAVVVFLVANTANFNQWVGKPLLSLPTDIGHAVTGAVGGTPTQGGVLFDGIWNKSYTAGLVVYRGAPNTFKAAILTALAVFMFWVLALLTIAWTFIIFVLSHVLVALLVAIGPLFVAAAIFPQSRFLFMGWLSAVSSAVIAQSLVMVGLAIMLAIETKELTQLTANQSAGANTLDQMQTLLGVACLLFIAVILTKQLPTVAVGIAHGVYHNTGRYTAAAVGAARLAGRGAVRAAGGWTGGGAAARPVGANRSGGVL